MQYTLLSPELAAKVQDLVDIRRHPTLYAEYVKYSHRQLLADYRKYVSLFNAEATKLVSVKLVGGGAAAKSRSPSPGPSVLGASAAASTRTRSGFW